jgi:pSer/pThr/pTyr-binding forkhead associated (FHA) protein
MLARLVSLVEGPDIIVDRDPVVVGRHPSCDVQLRSIRVSRRHCCLALVEGQVVVRDLGRTDGTQINDRQVESGRMQGGDVITIADLRFRMVVGKAPGTDASRAAKAPEEDGDLPTDPPGTRLFRTRQS